MITTQTQCRICGNRDLIEITDLGTHALSGRFPFQGEPTPMCAPLVILKCNDLVGTEQDQDQTHTKACGLVQLKHNVCPEELYFHNYGYRSGLNQTMTQHLGRLVQEVTEKLNRINFRDIILDIGSNDATLLKAYSYSPLIARYVGIDPIGQQFAQFYPSHITLIKEFFTADVFERVYPGEKAKVITSIAMFYDLPSPLKFMQDIKRILHPDGLWVLEQSYIGSMLDTLSFDTICHEHLEYYALKQMEWMARQAGLRIIDVTLNECNGGSFRVTMTHEENDYEVNQDHLDTLHATESQRHLDTLVPYQVFNQACLTIKTRLTTLLKNYQQHGKKIYLYGASTKGNTLLQYMGIDHTLIRAAAERNVEKYGRRTPQTDIPIISEEEMRRNKPDVLLVLPWHFKEEFVRREWRYLDEGGIMIFPLPRVEVVSSESVIWEHM
jgi:NDP-4-keto-2,6-dideoxyhexose 3-C-methyltransferase